MAPILLPENPPIVAPAMFPTIWTEKKKKKED